MNGSDKGKKSLHQVATKSRQKMTGHWVGDKAVVPSPHRSVAQNRYVSTTRSNIQHHDEQTLDKRANAFVKYQPKEEALVDSVSKRMENTKHNRENPSPEVMQSARMLHTQRGMFTGSEHLQQSKVGPSSDEARDLIGMFQRKEQGPLTFKQSQLGAEVAVTSVFMQDKDTLGAMKGSQLKAKRDIDIETGKPSHQTKSKFGMGLSQDTGTQVRDALGLPVMSGTSGTSSLMALSHRHASKVTQQEEADPTLSSDQQATETMANLSLQYMRKGVVPDSVASKTRENLQKQHPKKDLVSTPLNSTRVQTHSYPEIYSAVDLTRKGQSGDNVRAQVHSNLKAKQVLDSTPTPQRLPSGKLRSKL